MTPHQLIQLNRNRLLFVLRNLLSNGIQHSSEYSDLLVRISLRRSDSNATTNAATNSSVAAAATVVSSDKPAKSSVLSPTGQSVGDRLEVSDSARIFSAVLSVEVEDFGPGIAPAQRERIFTPFYSTTLNPGRASSAPAVINSPSLSHAGSGASSPSYAAHSIRKTDFQIVNAAALTSVRQRGGAKSASAGQLASPPASVDSALASGLANDEAADAAEQIGDYEDDDIDTELGTESSPVGANWSPLTAHIVGSTKTSRPLGSSSSASNLKSSPSALQSFAAATEAAVGSKSKQSEQYFNTFCASPSLTIPSRNLGALTKKSLAPPHVGAGLGYV